MIQMQNTELNLEYISLSNVNVAFLPCYVLVKFSKVKIKPEDTKLVVKYFFPKCEKAILRRL